MVGCKDPRQLRRKRPTMRCLAHGCRGNAVLLQHWRQTNCIARDSNRKNRNTLNDQTVGARRGGGSGFEFQRSSSWIPVVCTGHSHPLAFSTFHNVLEPPTKLITFLKLGRFSSCAKHWSPKRKLVLGPSVLSSPGRHPSFSPKLVGRKVKGQI